VWPSKASWSATTVGLVEARGGARREHEPLTAVDQPRAIQSCERVGRSDRVADLASHLLGRPQARRLRQDEQQPKDSVFDLSIFLGRG